MKENINFTKWVIALSGTSAILTLVGIVLFEYPRVVTKTSDVIDMMSYAFLSIWAWRVLVKNK